MISKMVLAMAFVLGAIACSSSDTGNGSSGTSGTSGTSGNDPNPPTSSGSTSTSTSSFCCGNNGNYYDCTSSETLSNCALKGITTGCTSRSTECPGN